MKQVYNFFVDVDNKKVEVAVKRPNHLQIEEAEFVFAQKFNHLLSQGFLSRSMMNKQYGDIGGLYSEKMVEDLSLALEKMDDCKRTIEFFDKVEDLDEEQKEKLRDARESYANITFNIANMDRDLEIMYANSADAKAEEHMIKWFVLNLSYFAEVVEKDGEEKKEFFPLFEGQKFEEKMASYSDFLSEVEEGEDEELSRKKKIVSESLGKLSRVINLWYNGMGENHESIEENYEKFFGDLGEPLKEKPKPVKKKAASKKVASQKEDG